MSLLRDIQDAAVSSSAPVSDLLRKCKILAARLRNDDFARWVDHELNGYPSTDGLPDYRVLKGVQSKGHFSGPAGSGLRNAPIPASTLPKEFREFVETQYMNSGVSQYEQLLDGKGEDAGSFSVPWPPDLTAMVGQRIYQYMNCLQAWKEIPRGSVVHLLDSVRNRVLGFALEIEKANPEAGDVPSNTSPIPERVVQQVFNNQIYGNVGNLASGSTQFSQHAEFTVSQGDFASLDKALRGMGIDAADVAALKSALSEDKKEKAPGLGKRAAAWIGQMIGKAANGLIGVGIETAGKVLPHLVSQYLGLPSGN